MRCDLFEPAIHNMFVRGTVGNYILIEDMLGWPLAQWQAGEPRIQNCFDEEEIIGFCFKLSENQ